MRYKKINLLLIEDDEEDFMILRDTLLEIKDQSYNLTWISDFNEAVSNLSNPEIDLFLVDYRLGQHTGLELLQLAHQMNCHAPFILLTGRSDDEIDQRAIEYGASDYLVKGHFDSSLLSRSIRYAIERKKSEEKLRHQTSILNAIINNAPMCIWLNDPHQKPILVNNYFKDNIGNSETESSLSIQDQMNLHQSDIHALSQETPYFIEESLTFRDGKRHILGIIRQKVADSSNNVIGVLGLGIDLTQLKHSEDQLYAEKHYLRMLIDTLPDYIYIKDDKSRFITLNNSLVKNLGLSSVEEAVGKTDFDFYPKPLAQKFYDDEQYIINSGETLLNYVEEGLDKHGNTTTILSTKVPVYNKSGKISGIVGIGRDITDRKKFEDALIKSEVQIKALLNNLPFLAWLKDSEGKFVEINDSFVKECGKTYDKIIGKTEFDIWPYDIAQNYLIDEMQVISSEKQKQSEEIKNKNGSTAWYETFRKPIYDAQGRLIGTTGFSREITERKIIENELKKAKEAAEEATQAKSQFLASMSHEIRTPLNGIIGMNEILKQTQVNVDQKEYIDIIDFSANNLLTIINDILDFSKIEAGQIELEKTPFNLIKSIDKIIQMVSVKSKDKQIEFHKIISPEVPATVKGDPVRINQILLNLTNNAVKFTEKGSISITVEVLEETQSNLKLMIKVIDTGIGIKEGGKARLFKEFSQVSAYTTRKHGGTGLGLAISKRLTELMQGEIGVESEVGKGSTFWFTILIEKADESISESSANLEIVLPFRPLDILIAEDNLINQKVVKTILENMGHKVVIAQNGIEALDFYNTSHFDIIFMDINMPLMDGVEATKKIRVIEQNNQQQKKMRIIALTANVVKEDVKMYLAAGMNDYITKPFKVSDLQNVLEGLG